MAQDDYYQLLGVRRGASLGEIKRAFRTRVLESHPDHHPDSGLANERTRLLIEAYKTLTDTGRRRFYDVATSPYVASAASIAYCAPSARALAVARFLRVAFAVVILAVAALCLAQAISCESIEGKYTFSNIESITQNDDEIPAYVPISSDIIPVSSTQRVKASPVQAWSTQPPAPTGETQPFSPRLPH